MSGSVISISRRTRSTPTACWPPRKWCRGPGGGVELLALSDHDSVDGVAEAVVAGEREGVAIVPAVEISALHGDSETSTSSGSASTSTTVLAAALADFRADE